MRQVVPAEESGILGGAPRGFLNWGGSVATFLRDIARVSSSPRSEMVSCGVDIPTMKTGSMPHSHSSSKKGDMRGFGP